MTTTSHELSFSRKQKTFTNEQGHLVEFTERLIIIDGIEYRVNSKEGKVFDLQFRDELFEGSDDE